MKSYFFTTVLVTCLFYSCKKNESENQNFDPYYIRFSKDALAYVQIPSSKYFIYKDSASGILDSVVARSSLQKKMYPAIHNSNSVIEYIPAVYYEEFSLLLEKFDSIPLNAWFFGRAKSYQFGILAFHNSDSASLNLEEDNSLTTSGQTLAFMYPFIPDLINQTQSIMTSMDVEGKTYSNVVIYSNANLIDSSNVYFIKTTYYWVKNLGIIKRIIKTSNSVKTATLVRNG